jgi:hypothetical protein
MPTRSPWLVLLPLAALLAGCGGDDGDAASTPSTETTTLDPGVTFENDVTVPTGTGPTTTTAAPADVVSRPGEVPNQFPESFPVPDGAEVEIGSVGQAEGEIRMAVDYTIANEDPAAVMDFYRQAVDDAGFSVLLDDDDGTGRNFVGTLVFETDTYIGNVLVSGDGSRGVLLSLTATLPD